VRYKWKTKPYKHQVLAIRKLISNGFGGALLMAPRTGKTKVVVDYASMLTQAGRIRKVLIVCPNKVMGTWVREIHKHCPWYFTIRVWDKDARKSSLTTTQSAEVEFVIVNYEAFGVPGAALRDRKTGAIRKVDGRIKRSKTKGGRYAAKREIVRWVGQDDALCVLDESHRAKNPSGRSANMVISLGPYFRYRVLATGTPVTKAKRAFDVYMQWKFLNPARFADWPTVEGFKNMTGRWIDRNGYPQWVGPREQGMRILRERIHADSYAITREECFDLPKSDIQIRKVKLTGESARVYDAMAQNMVAELKNGEMTEASIALVLAIRLAQITSGFTKTTEEFGSKLRRVGRDKLNALEEFIDDAVEHDEKLIIVARFKPDCHCPNGSGQVQSANVRVARWGIHRGLRSVEV
jgi:hypothetical protein